MEDNTQEGRERVIEHVLSRRAIADDEDELFEQEAPSDGQQVEEEIPEMPAELATPTDLRRQTKAEFNGEKKKKKKKSKTANLPEAGTALEDDYVEKHAEDLIENPFDPERPISQRIEYAIWKYRKNHKFSEEKKTIFDQYLKFGGIKTGPNMFLGRATSADAPDDPEAEITATDYVPDELEEGVEINFAEVAQAFFGNYFVSSSRFIRLLDFIDGPVLIDAFLRYLEIRNVAPEYAEDIAKARSFVAEAKIQLPKCKKASSLLPGEYNPACKKIFGGEDQEKFDVSWWTGSSGKIYQEMSGFLKEAALTDSVEKMLVESRIKNPDSLKVVETKETIPIKILEIAPFSPDAGAKKLVKVTFGNYDESKQGQDTYDIYFEREITQHLMVGMVIQFATICRLSNGDCYLKDYRDLCPTFYMVDDCIQDEHIYW